MTRWRVSRCRIVVSSAAAPGIGGHQSFVIMVSQPCGCGSSDSDMCVGSFTKRMSVCGVEVPMDPLTAVGDTIVAWTNIAANL